MEPISDISSGQKNKQAERFLDQLHGYVVKPGGKYKYRDHPLVAKRWGPVSKVVFMRATLTLGRAERYSCESTCKSFEQVQGTPLAGVVIVMHTRPLYMSGES